MSAPNVRIKEIDLSQRVPGFPGVYGAIVIPTTRGPIQDPTLITSESHLMRKYTPNNSIEIGMSLGYFSALAFLEKSDKLLVMRAIGDNYTYGGLNIMSLISGTPNAAWTTGEEDPEAHVAGVAESFALYANDPGDWNDNVGVKIWLPRSIENVNLGDIAGNIGFGPETAATGDLDSKILITAVAGVAGNITINIEDDIAAHGIAEISSVTCVADVASSLNNKYFTINALSGPYYVWFNVGAAGVDPTPGGTGIEVAIAEDASASTVASAVQVAVNTEADFNATVNATIVIITNVEVGNVVASAAGNSGFTITTSTQGVDPSAIATVVDGIMTVTIHDANTTQAMIAAAIDGNVLINTVVADTPTGKWTLGVGTDTVDLLGGTSGPNTITVTQNFVSGEPVKFRLVGTGTMPSPLIADQVYYVNGVDATTIKLATTQADAIASTNLIDITTSGAGIMSLNPIKVIKETSGFLIEVFYGTDTVNPVEEWIVSLTEGQKNGYGQNMYIEDLLAGSEYIRATTNPLVLGDPRPQVTILKLHGGDDGDTVTDGDMMIAADKFSSDLNYPVTVLMDGGWATPAYQTHLISIVESRKDCVTMLSVPYDKEASSNYLNEIVDYRRTVLNASTSYAALYTPHVKVYDKYNDRALYVAPDGYAAAAVSYSAYNYEMWFPPAGFRRGMINVLDCRRRFITGEMDYLYDNDINPLRFYVGRGIMIWGQKTLYGRPSALDRLNVRLLLIVIEPAIAKALEEFIFEVNDDITRRIVVSLIYDYMTGIQARRGVYEFTVQCDTENNLQNDIDNHRLNVDLFIKPTISIEYIHFTTVIMRTGMSFALAQAAV